MPTNYQEKLQSLLRELFQFDSADLDFGFYAVMNQKRDVIAKFISEDLPKLIKEGLEAVATQNRAELETSFEQARQRVIDTLGEDAFDGDKLKDYPAGTPAGKAYLAEKEKLDKAFVPDDVEAQIYNDLYTFFARYYQDGDFISQRRYGASDKYAVPYNGEEVLLHWANFDQYYVKTGVHFQNYSFVVPGSVGEEGTQVQVRLTKVNVQRDNVKGDKRFFVFADEVPVEWDAENYTLVIPMEYRPLTPEESSFAGTRNQQDKLLEAAYAAILAAIPNKGLKARLMEVDPQKNTEKNRLMYHLNRYAAENTRDFFVHKDLGSFLRREFDYYLKAEVLRLEDIDFSDTIFAERKAAQLKTTRHIGEAIIRFLDQLERFQRQLFLKKKFVLQSDYCLTLDKIPAEKRADFYPEILANERQLAEWKKLYGVTITAETNLDFQPHLMLDTAFFDPSVKYRLLACFENLDELADGILINSENFQALRLLIPTFREQIKSIYIDPPYNTNASEIIYRNGFKHSSWLALLANRLELAQDLLNADGILCVTIDDFEFHRLFALIRQLFGVESFLGVASIRSNPSGRSTLKGFAISHEYGIFTAKHESATVGRLSRSEKQLARYGESDQKGRFEWVNFRKHGGLNANRFARPKLFYPIRINQESKIRVPEIKWNEIKREWEILEDERGDEVTIFPINSRGEEKTWKWGHDTLLKNLDDFVAKPDIDKNLGIYMKSRMKHEGVLPSTWWDKKKYSATDYGTNLLGDLLGDNSAFSFPKSVYAAIDSLRVANLEENDICLDFFAGSGTTGHAVMQLNQEDDGNRKYLLVEMGEYFDSVLKPRIQKVAFADEWKDGKPILPKNGQASLLSSGQSHMFQYMRLESYDDTFHNIRFREDTGPQTNFFDDIDYLLGYMLDHETVGSPTLLDIEQFKRPFDYKLLVTGEDGVLREQPVDLVATFNFLLGLSVQTIRRYEENGRPYVRVTGTTPEGSRVCVLWRNGRSVDELDAETEWVLANVLHDVAYDKLYVNGETTIPDALLIEDAFKRRMFEGVS